MRKKNLVILFGGPSVEHDVSVISGMQVVKNANESKYEILPIYWDGSSFWMAKKTWLNSLAVAKSISNGNRREVVLHHGTIYNYGGLGLSHKISNIDCVIPVFHGTSGEDGVIQGFLDTLKLPYVGSGVPASVIGMDKNLFKIIMRHHKLPVLDWEVVAKLHLNSFKTTIPFPVIVKPTHLGSSIGVKKCSSHNEVKLQLEVVFELDNEAIIEPYLSNVQEINCSVLGDAENNQASVCEQPISVDEILSFDDKYLHGNKNKGAKHAGIASLDRRMPAPISIELTVKIQNLAKQVFTAIGAGGVARVDFMIDKGNNIYITEINTIPGSLSYYLWEASGVSFRELLDRLVEIAEMSYSSKHVLLRRYDSHLLKK